MEKGYFKKFEVKRANTGEVVNEECFVLIPSHDPVAKVAILAYADATDNKELAKDLRALVGK